MHWIEHYAERLEIKKEEIDEIKKRRKRFLEILEEHAGAKPLNILEWGSGPGRSALALSLGGHNVTAIEIVKEMAESARNNFETHAKNKPVKTKQMDGMRIVKEFGKDSFDAVTHQGILEHFSPKKIKEMLEKQLTVAPVIVCSVPIESDYNNEYFKEDEIKRCLKPAGEWLKLLEKDFEVVHNEEARQNSDDLILVIRKKTEK